MNERDIKALRWDGKDRRFSLGDCLYLQVRNNSKTFLVIKRGKTRSSTTTLGRVTGSNGRGPELSLREARQKAVLLNTTTAEDISTKTVAELVDKFYQTQVEPKQKRPKQTLTYFNHIKDELGRKKVKDIRRAQLVGLIEKYSERGPRSADRLRGYLKTCFGYAVEIGWIDSSPMAEVTKRVSGYTQVPRKRILTDKEIRWLFTHDHHHTRALRFLLLTGLRVGEMWRGYQDGDFWRVEDTKGRHRQDERRPHWVYLTDSAKACLPIKKVSNERLQHWLRKQQDEPDRTKRWTPHDCRRTFATMANEHGVMPYIVEKCLNHRMEGVMAVYNHAEYADERIQAAKTVERAILKQLEES